MRTSQMDETGSFPAGDLVQLVHQQRGHMSPRQRVDGYRALVVRARLSRRTRWFPVRSAALAAALCVVVFGAARILERRSSALSYAVEDGRVERGGAIEAAPARQARLKFSDGTEVRFGAGSKASLRSVDDHGALVSFADGEAHVDVVHRPGARWLFEAGPFAINVTGTAFTVAWRAGEEQLDVHMERGSVAVSGPLSDGPIVLRSGQHLIVRVHQRETVIRDSDEPVTSPAFAATAELGTGEVPTAAARALVPRVRSTALSSRSVATIPARDQDWATELANGDFEAIVRQAENGGLEACLAEVSSRDLSSLGDAARYARHNDVARRALVAQRRRFPQSDAAHDGAFLLGRIDEAEQSRSHALEWYERYLREMPNGTYASEALGRRMNLTQQLFGEDRARDVAEEYLLRFPQGAYAERARALVRGR